MINNTTEMKDYENHNRQIQQAQRYGVDECF